MRLIDRTDVMAALAAQLQRRPGVGRHLVAKSLIAADVGGALQRYRLLETTPAYALEKLAASGQLEAVKRR